MREGLAEAMDFRVESDADAEKKGLLVGCFRKLGSMVRINGLFHLLINGVLLGL